MQLCNLNVLQEIFIKIIPTELYFNNQQIGTSTSALLNSPKNFL